MAKHKILIGVVSILIFLVLFILINFLLITFNGKEVPTPNIPRGQHSFGAGPPLTYVVMGDSTAVAQGAEYADGYAMATVRHLAKTYRVSFANTGISGATTRNVAQKQLAEAAAYKPDIVLIAAGANDVTHFSSNKTIEQSMQTIVNTLKSANPDVKIIVTGAAAMDTVDRFTWPAKRLAHARVTSINKTFVRVAEKNNLTWAPIADKTREAFKADPTLFAQDKFHPNARGYALWTAVLLPALDKALLDKPL